MLLPTPVCTPGDVARVLSDPRLVVIDCRFDLADTGAGRRAFAESRMPGARYAHLDDDLSDPAGDGRRGRHPLPDPDRMAARLATLGIHPDCHVLAYDASGGAIAARLWWMVRRLGHDAVSLLDGGWPAWVASGHPIETGPSSARTVPGGPVTWPGAEKRASMQADVHAVLRAAEDGMLFDARAAERFRGEVEPIDAVAGHIPGARSAPFLSFLDGDGTFLRPEVLRQRFPASWTDADRTVVYCGSGVTACHLIVSAVQAGLPEPALYAPSWSGWISDPSRPVRTGGTPTDPE